MSTDPIVIVGGGLAAARAIEAIRESDTQTPIVLVGKEDLLPYERPPLSKGVMLGNDAEDVAFTHPREWYDEQHVELRLGVAADRLDAAARTVTLSDGSDITYSAVLLATGSGLRKLDVPGADLVDVLYLRSMRDSAAIKARLVAGSEVVIVGAGWIGLEVAAAARHHGAEVTVVEPQPTPLFGVVGEQVGQWFADLHRAHGVTFRFGEGVDRFEGDDEGRVNAVVTTSGERLSADTVVVGVGIRPNTRLAELAGLDVDNGIVVDEGLRASAEGVWAAGDVANWFNPTLGTQVRVEHWANAQDGGYAAGRSIAGDDIHYDAIPFFFSDQYDIGIEYAGYVPGGTDAEVVLRGDLATNEFMAFWVVPAGEGDSEGEGEGEGEGSDGGGDSKGDRVRVLAGMHVNLWDSLDPVQQLIRARTVVSRVALADVSQPLADLV